MIELQILSYFRYWVGIQFVFLAVVVFFIYHQRKKGKRAVAKQTKQPQSTASDTSDVSRLSLRGMFSLSRLFGDRDKKSVSKFGTKLIMVLLIIIISFLLWRWLDWELELEWLEFEWLWTTLDSVNDSVRKWFSDFRPGITGSERMAVFWPFMMTLVVVWFVAWIKDWKAPQWIAIVTFVLLLAYALFNLDQTLGIDLTSRCPTNATCYRHGDWIRVPDHSAQTVFITGRVSVSKSRNTNLCIRVTPLGEDVVVADGRRHITIQAREDDERYRFNPVELTSARCPLRTHLSKTDL